MMEIPAGKWCDTCPLGHVWDNAAPNGDEAYVCSLFPTEPQRIEDSRIPACLSAYPNGATIEIKPKEAH